MKQITLIYVVKLMCVTSGFSVCAPAEEGKPYRLSYEWTALSDHTEVTVRKDGLMFGKCDTTVKCTSYYPKRVTLFTTNMTGGRFNTSVDITKVDRTYASEWLISYIGSRDGSDSTIVRCKLETFFIAATIKCKDLQDNGENEMITCYVHKIFPEAVCFFDVYINEKKSTINNDNNTDVVKYNHTPFEDDGLFYMSTCTYKIIKPTHAMENYRIKIKIAPKLSSLNSNALYSLEPAVNISLPFKVEKSKYLIGASGNAQNCNDVAEVQVNTLMNCVCTLNSTKISIFSASWHSSKDHLNNGNYIVLNINKTTTEFTCKESERINIIQHELVFLDNIILANCSLYWTVDNLNFTCHPKQITPKVNCYFNFSLGKNLLKAENPKHDSQSQSCTIVLDMTEFERDGLYRIEMTLLKYSTQTYSVMDLETNSFAAHRTDAYVNYAQSKLESRMYQIISCTAVAAIFFILITTAFIYIKFVNTKRNHRKNKNNLNSVISPLRQENDNKMEKLSNSGNYTDIIEEDHYDLYSSNRNESPVDVHVQQSLEAEYITPLDLEDKLNAHR